MIETYFWQTMSEADRAVALDRLFSMLQVQPDSIESFIAFIRLRLHDEQFSQDVFARFFALDQQQVWQVALIIEYLVAQIPMGYHQTKLPYQLGEIFRDGMMRIPALTLDEWRQVDQIIESPAGDILVGLFQSYQDVVLKIGLARLIQHHNPHFLMHLSGESVPLAIQAGAVSAWNGAVELWPDVRHFLRRVLVSNDPFARDIAIQALVRRYQHDLGLRFFPALREGLPLALLDETEERERMKTNQRIVEDMLLLLSCLAEME